MTEAQARQRIVEIDEELNACPARTGDRCRWCDDLREERRDLRAYLDSLKGETA